MPVQEDVRIATSEVVALIPAYHPLAWFEHFTEALLEKVMRESGTLRAEFNTALHRAEEAYAEARDDQFEDWAVPHIDLPILRRWLDQCAGLI